MKSFFYLLIILRIIHVHFAAWNKEDRYTRIITLKQGSIQGRIIKPKRNLNLPSVETYLGVPYAAPPVANLRFMPPGAPLPWPETLSAFSMKPVCPQMLPNLESTAQKKMSPERNAFIKRMKQNLRNESEDCLYLNIYVPQSFSRGMGEKKYPVILFIHGESFEWNSGNLYDGTIMASCGNIIFITINFRLGIFGFLKQGIMIGRANFGLSDQIAALQWIKHNIAEFGGDPSRITVMGHDTGAACVNFLMLSPVAEGLFHRAILMSGSALSEWALTAIPLHYIQLKDEFYCASDNIINCLQKKRKEDIISAFKKYDLLPFENFTPAVDDIVVLNSPADQMEKYSLFSKYDLLAGVNEVESYYLLEEEFLRRGMLLDEATNYFDKYTKIVFKKTPNSALVKTIEQYFGRLKNLSPFVTRDAVLDALSDLLVTAPLLQTVRYHASTPKNTFFYVFGHHTASERHIKVNRSIYGDDLPYALGVPLDPPSNHYISTNYTDKEEQLSEMMLKYFANFARTGNPYSSQITESSFRPRVSPRQYELEWPSYNLDKQLYLRFGIPPYINRQYRSEYDRFWNQAKLTSMKHYDEDSPLETEEVNKNSDFVENDDNRSPSTYDNHNPPTYDLGTPQDLDFFHRSTSSTPQLPPPYPIDEKPTDLTGDENEISSAQTSAFTATALIIVATVFLLVNVAAFAFIFYQRGKLRVRENLFRNRFRCKTVSVPDIFEENENGDIYAIVENRRKETEANKRNENKKSRIRFKRGSKATNKRNTNKTSTQSAGARIASVKPEAICGKRLRRWPLSRQCSGSTVTAVDAQSRVRDWIAHEIVNPCSPRFLRRSKKRRMENVDSPGLGRNEEIESVALKPIPMKVSVSVDATPAARTESVLKQLPIELAKSLKDVKNPMSVTPTLSTASTNSVRKKDSFGGSNTYVGSDNSDEYSGKMGTHKSSARIRLKTPDVSIDFLPTFHSHSKSDPSPIGVDDFVPQPLYSSVNKKTAKTAAESAVPQYEEINVTSLPDIVDEGERIAPTVEQTVSSLAKRFPKVLPDISDAGRKQNRFSLPLSAWEDSNSQGCFGGCVSKNTFKLRVPPAPPPRLTSTLGRAPVSDEDREKQCSHFTVQLRKDLESVTVEGKSVDLIQTEVCDNVPK